MATRSVLGVRQLAALTTHKCGCLAKTANSVIFFWTKSKDISGFELNRYLVLSMLSHKMFYPFSNYNVYFILSGLVSTAQSIYLKIIMDKFAHCGFEQLIKDSRAYVISQIIIYYLTSFNIERLIEPWLKRPAYRGN